MAITTNSGVTLGFDSGGSGGGGATFGALNNAGILAVGSPSDLDNAFSTDDFIIYTFYQGDWYSTAGGILV